MGPGTVELTGALTTNMSTTRRISVDMGLSITNGGMHRLVRQSSGSGAGAMVMEALVMCDDCVGVEYGPVEG
jgi:hypothetical protein